MSSLQRRVLESSSTTSRPLNSKITGQTDTKASFESCFSAGLDLAEFASSASHANNSTHRPSAAAELAQIKLNEAAKSKIEEQEEEVLEQRVANVVAAKSLEATSFQSDDHAPRALNPHAQGYATGESRDNNFTQFQNSSIGSDNGFLSSLVQNHKSERQSMSLSRRTLASKNKVGSTSATSKMQHQRKPNNMIRGGSTRQLKSPQAKKFVGSNKKLVVKKSTKSKY